MLAFRQEVYQVDEENLSAEEESLRLFIGSKIHLSELECMGVASSDLKITWTDRPGVRISGTSVRGWPQGRRLGESLELRRYYT